MLNSENSKEAVSERRRLEEQNEALRNELMRVRSAPPKTIGQHIDFIEEEPDEEELEPPEDPDDNVADFASYHRARNEERRQADHPDYGDTVFATDDQGNVKPQILRWHQDDLVAYEKYRAREEAKRRERLAPQRTARVVELFARKQAAKPGPTPAPRPKTMGEKFADWLTRPAGPPVWK